MTEKEQAEAILAAINAAIAPTVAYEYDKVPGAYGNAGTRPLRFAAIAISRRYVGKKRGSGEVSTNGYRIQVRYAAKATNDARNMREKTTAVLEDKILTSEAGEVGPFVFETSQAFGPDDGYQSGSDTYIF